MKKDYTLKKLFSFLALILFASFVYGQTNIYTETFNDTANIVNTPDFQMTGSDYFWWGQDSDFSMLNTFAGEDGTYYIGAEDTNGSGLPGECSITLPSVALTGYSNVEASVMLAASNDYKYDDPDYIIFEYQKDGVGDFIILGAFYGHDWIGNDAYNGPLREDTNLDGDANETGTELNATFQTFSYSIDPTSTSVILRVRIKMSDGDEEIGIDNIQLNDMPSNVDVTMNVDMNYQETLGNFNPLTDFVDVAGDMNSWGGTVMADPDGDGIYSYTFTGIAISTIWNYKFRINGTVWETVSPDRNYTTVNGVNIVDHFFNNDAGPVNVTFTIIDGTESYLDIELKGTFTSWSLEQMYDDGTNGDAVANDHTWSVTLAVSGGAHEWGAIENDGSVDGLWLVGSPNLAITVNTDGTYTGQDSFEILPPGNIDVIFQVNMNEQIALGAFDPLTDFVDVAGSMNSWGGSAALDDTDGNGIYSITIGGFYASDFVEFKFRKNGSWSSTELDGQSNRNYTVIDQVYNKVTHWYNDFQPVDLFFSEYIEGSSNNKALEIYNNTGATVNLNDYIIRANYNGTPFNGFHTFPVGATLADGDVWVIANSSADALILAQADEQFAYNQSSYIVGYNGDDCRALCKIITTDTIAIDIIGEERVDPGSGYDVAGEAAATANHTIVRKSTVTKGNVNWSASAGTDVTSSEWVVLVQDEFSYIGFHPHVFSTLVDVTFNVNMNYQITQGNFTVGADFVDVAGNMNGWSGTVMDDTDGDGIYTVIIGGISATAPANIINYKFRINGTGWESLANDRTYTVVDPGPNEVTHWFNDELPIQPNDLFFSEYIEGSSNNKALEIYNNSGATVNLDNYLIGQAVNGGGWAYNHTFPVGATLADGDVWVIITNTLVLPLFDPANADEILSYPSVVHHSGDDARCLYKISGTDTTIIDIIGDPDNDPGNGWTVAGIADATKEHTMVRKSTVTNGNIDWLSSAGTDATNSEWVILPQNECSYLGSHPHTFATLADVTINVDMSYQITQGNFIVGTDFLDVAGTFNSWAGGDLFTDTDGDQIYTAVLLDIVVGDTIYFKCRINGDWNTSEFPGGGPEREYVVQGTNNIVNFWYNDEEPVTVVTVYDIQYTTDPSGDSPYNGQIVSTSGLVTAVTTDKYFIQDGIGAWNGIYVYDPSNTPAIGDHITIVAEASEYYNLTELYNVSSYTLNNSGNTLPPAVVITTLDAGLEMYEGVLVQVVGAECTNPDAGYGEWHVDDGTGMAIVDDMIFAFTPDSGNVYDITGVMTYSFGAFKLIPRDINDITDVTVIGDSQTLTFPYGWSIFSSYLVPFTPMMDDVFAPIVSDVILIKNGDGQVYWPAFVLNAIGQMVVGEGYQANLANAQSLIVTGTQVVPETTIFNISQGWSIIGYLRNTPGDAVAMFTSITNEVIICKNGNGQVYWPLYGLNMIGNLTPGEGYQMNMATMQPFSYPANGPVAKSNTVNYTPTYYNLDMNTGCNMTLGIPSNAWRTAPNFGDEVGVFTKSGLLVGSSVYTNDNMAVTIWGTNDYSETAMGTGEQFIIKVWNQQSGLESVIPVSSWLSGDDFFKKDGISVISDISNGNSLTNYPNPANAYTEIVYTISNDTYVNLSVYNSLGEKVETLVSGSTVSGSYNVMLNTSSYEAGTYFYVLSTNESVKTNSLQVIK